MQEHLPAFLAPTRPVRREMILDGSRHGLARHTVPTVRWIQTPVQCSAAGGRCPSPRLFPIYFGLQETGARRHHRRPGPGPRRGQVCLAGRNRDRELLIQDNCPRYPVRRHFFSISSFGLSCNWWTATAGFQVALTSSLCRAWESGRWPMTAAPAVVYLCPI